MTDQIDVAGLVAIKPLEWTGLSASTPFGDYEVARYGNTWAVYLYRDLVAERHTEEAAKLAAQGDLEFRIRSALTAPSTLASLTAQLDAERTARAELEAQVERMREGLNGIASFSGKTLISVDLGHPYSIGANAAFEEAAALARAFAEPTNGDNPNG
jgi:hypothetical protein